MPAVVPDLTEEVLSKGNTRKEIETKLDEYFAAGVTTAWVIDPRKNIARLYDARDDVTEIDLDGVLRAPKVLPGFELPLRELLNLATRGAPN